MTKTLLEKWVIERNNSKLKEGKNNNLPPDPITTIPSIGPMEEIAKSLRNYFFGTGILSYFKQETIVPYNELRQSFIDLKITGNYKEFDKIFPGLDNLKIKYDNAWQSCQLEVKRLVKKTKKIEENIYVMTKGPSHFSENEKIENPNKEKRISLKELLED